MPTLPEYFDAVLGRLDLPCAMNGVHLHGVIDSGTSTTTMSGVIVAVCGVVKLVCGSVGAWLGSCAHSVRSVRRPSLQPSGIDERSPGDLLFNRRDDCQGPVIFIVLDTIRLHQVVRSLSPESGRYHFRVPRAHARQLCRSRPASKYAGTRENLREAA